MDLRSPPARRLALAALVALGCSRGAGAALPPGDAAPSGSGARVVSLHDVTTEIVVALGATDALVGVAGPVDLAPAARSATVRLPRAEGAESIAALAPSLVLGMAVVEERAPELVGFLRGRGLEVFLGAPRTLDDLFSLVEAIGARVNRQREAKALVNGLRDELGAEPPAHEPVRVFVYDCCEPPFTAGGRTVLTDLLRRAGGRNVFADLDAAWTKVSWEEVIARRPELILIHDYAFDGQTDVRGKRGRLADFPSLRGVPTTVLPLGAALGGLRSVEAVKALRAAIARGRGRG